jgi:hypothetical protein
MEILCSMESLNFMYMLSPRSGFDRVALVGRPRRGSASGVVEGFAREADPRLGRNISTRDAESLLAASRSLNSYYPRSGSASGLLKRPRSGALPT